MPIKQSIWRIGQKPTALMQSKLKNEEILEDMIENDSSILEDEWMIIGRQVVTKHKKEIDLLAIAPDGSLVVIELKKSKTPRDVVAQAIDYALCIGTVLPHSNRHIVINCDYNKILLQFLGKRRRRREPTCEKAMLIWYYVI